MAHSTITEDSTLWTPPERLWIVDAIEHIVPMTAIIA